MRYLGCSILLFILFPIFGFCQDNNHGLRLSGILIDGNSFYKANNYQKKITTSRMATLEYFKNFGKGPFKPWSLLFGAGFSKIGINKIDTLSQVDYYHSLLYLKPQVTIRRREPITKKSLFFIDLGVAFNYGAMLKSYTEAGERKKEANFGNTFSIIGGGSLYHFVTKKIKIDIGVYGEFDVNKLKAKQLHGLKLIKNCIQTSAYYSF